MDKITLNTDTKCSLAGLHWPITEADLLKQMDG